VRYVQWGLNDDFNMAILTIQRREEEQNQ